MNDFWPSDIQLLIFIVFIIAFILLPLELIRLRGKILRLKELEKGERRNK
jgi:hypothetical protein